MSGKNPEVATLFTGSNFLLPTFMTGGKWDFQVTNLLLAAVNLNPGCLACPMNISESVKFYIISITVLNY